MIDEIGRFARQPALILACRGDDGLDRFFADFLRDFRDTLAEKAGSVGAGRAAPRAVVNGAREPGQDASRGIPETGWRPGVTGGALLPDDVEHGIPVAVDADIFDHLLVSRGFALAPEDPAAAAVVVRLAGLSRAGQCLAIGVGDHQHLAGQGALSDDGDESVVPEVHCLKPVFATHFGKLSAPACIVKSPARRIICAPCVGSRARAFCC